MEDFYKRLEKAMYIRDISAAELARRSGVTEGSISQYRRGYYKASQKTLEKLAKALDISVAWLMGYNVSIERTPSGDTSDGSHPNEAFPVTKEEEDIITAFRNNPQYRPALLRLLGIEDGEPKLLSRTFSEDPHEPNPENVLRLATPGRQEDLLRSKYSGKYSNYAKKFEKIKKEKQDTEKK